LTAPLLVVHGAHDTNVPVSESEQIVDALREAGRDVRYLCFSDDGHEIAKRENRAKLAAAMRDWLNRTFSESDGQSAEVS
jgi:dipeptidyl aminopeptidase/acylaminoacyl peptidase